MPTYVVLWADNPGLNPGDDFAPLSVEGHPGLHFWYQEFVEHAAQLRESGTIPDYWVRFAGVQPDGSWRKWRCGGELFQAANPTELEVKVAERQWS